MRSKRNLEYSLRSREHQVASAAQPCVAGAVWVRVAGRPAPGTVTHGSLDRARTGSTPVPSRKRRSAAVENHARCSSCRFGANRNSPLPSTPSRSARLQALRQGNAVRFRVHAVRRAVRRRQVLLVPADALVQHESARVLLGLEGRPEGAAAKQVALKNRSANNGTLADEILGERHLGCSKNSARSLADRSRHPVGHWGVRKHDHAV